MNYYIIVMAILLLWGHPQSTADDNAYTTHCVSEEEMRLSVLINNYRRQHNLPPVPLSKSLSYVARQHVIDLQDNVKTLTHAWSSCEYKNNDASTYNCMWLKPRELTSYTAYGYECAYSNFPHNANADEALNTWKRSPGHNNVIINRGPWRNIRWQALGVGIYKNYITIWFGEETDAEGIPPVCD